MSRYFLGPIKNPTWKDFFIRVGGAAAVIVITIFTAKAFFPGHEGYAVIFVAVLGIAVVVIQSLRHDINNKKIKQRIKKK